ncbi:MAG TPA: glycosyltransferase [Phenylobacterium sp.]|uniref:glycosyltransferase n=1 Tax=Phenylobacterium sp. TaxID=1871053 RepID=UPI002B4874CA|nr:glycosyltransferase [Phenylobacterium sp.]HKR88557.1 glycosyltransferase [Phenylobacterium sp.]
MASKLGVIIEQQAVPKGAAPGAGAVAPAAAGRAFASAERAEGRLGRAFAQASAPRPVLLAALFYRHAELARQLGASLLRCAEELRAIDAEVLFVNDSPDDSELAAALEELTAKIGSAFTWRVQNNPRNLGFVGSCNRVIAEAVGRGMDLLLLNSDTVVVPGAFREMVRVSRLDPMIGFVNPRSNNATLATLPYQDRFRDASAIEAEAGWRQLSPLLPELSYVPTAVGFCLLIRWGILAEFGGFDEIYGRGYNEENDLIMRAGRRGYRAVLANHAFVWHEGHTSFGRSPEALALEARNREILVARYPEYDRLADDYFDSAEQRAELLLGALLPDSDGRIDVALDFSTFTTAHNGTMIAGEQLLAAAAELWGDRYRLHVLASPEVYDFHGYARYGAPRCDPHGPEVFAAVFRVGQPFDWNTLERLIMKAATIGVFMLDTISLDCAQLTSQKLSRYWTFVLEHLDLLAVTSELTGAQIERRLPIGADVKRARSLHSLDLADYELPLDGAAAPAPPGFVFVVGNHFWHKEVAATVNALAEADPDRTVVVLAGPSEEPEPVDEGLYAPTGIRAYPNVLRLRAGELSHEEIGAVYRDASAIVFPSHYEGFGIPLLNALAAKKPVLIRPLPVFAEMVNWIGEDPNIHVFETTADLVERLDQPLGWREHGAVAGRAGDARRAAEDVGEALDRMVAGASYVRIARRIRAFKTLRDFSSIQPAPEPPPGDSKTFIAASIGHSIEAIARRLLDVPGILDLSRACYRALRRLSGAPAPPA